MRAFRRCVLFFVILILMLYGLSQIVNVLVKSGSDLIQSRNKSIAGIQNEKEDSVDVLVLGDSESYTSVSTVKLWNQYGTAAYIGGQAGQNIQETYYMLRTALQNQSPKIVVLETNVLFREQKGVKGIQEGLIQKANYYFPIFRYHDFWKPVLFGKEYAEESFKGFMLRETVESYKGGEYMKETKEKDRISEMVKHYMDEILELCKEKKVSFFLYSAPSPVNYNYRRHNALKEYAREIGVPYEDLNLKAKKIGIDWEMDTMDRGDHLNLAGADKVTEYLGRIWKETFDLPDRREDPEYSQWQKEAREYTQRAEYKLQRMHK